MKVGELNVFTTVTNIIKKYHNGRDLVIIGDNLDFVDFLRENNLNICQHYLITPEDDNNNLSSADAPNNVTADNEKESPDDTTIAVINDSSIQPDTTSVSSEILPAENNALPNSAEVLSDSPAKNNDTDLADASSTVQTDFQADTSASAEHPAISDNPAKIKNDDAVPEGASARDLPPELDPLCFVRNNHHLAENCYLLFTEVKRSKELKLELQELGYKEFKDYVFANHGRIIVKAGYRDYTDEYSNFVHSRNCKVFLNDFCCNVRINVDDTAVFDDKCYISARHMGLSEVNIGPECRFIDSVSLVVAGEAKLTIGKGTKIVQNSGVVVLEGNSVTIGEKCLFSYDVKIYSGDGHAIFDSDTKNRLNPPTFNDKNKIIIGNYVWVGMRAVIMNHCNIGDSCIIGAGSIVKGTFPNNCALGGNPARLIRKNVVWTHNYTDGMIEDCPEEYILPTIEDF